MIDKEYRHLNPDEVIHKHEGDECSNKEGTPYTWWPTLDVHTGKTPKDFPHRNFRRPITPEPKREEEPNWSTSMGAMLEQEVMRLSRENDSLKSQLAAANQKLEVAVSSLRRKGYREECSIAACNCGNNWSHGGHAEERLREISDEVWENGKTALQSVKDIIARAELSEQKLAEAEKKLKDETLRSHIAEEELYLLRERYSYLDGIL